MEQAGRLNPLHRSVKYMQRHVPSESNHTDSRFWPRLAVKFVGYKYIVLGLFRRLSGSCYHPLDVANRREALSRWVHCYLLKCLQSAVSRLSKYIINELEETIKS